MSNALLDYLQRELDAERGTLDGLDKVAAELDSMDYDELVALNEALDQESQEYLEKQAGPLDMMGWADAMGRYLARGEVRKVAAANGDVSGAMMSEAVELLTGGHIQTLEDSQAAMQKIAALQKLGKKKRKKADTRKGMDSAGVGALLGGAAGFPLGLTPIGGPIGAAIGAKEGRRGRSALGALGGGVGGTLLGAIGGAIPGALLRSEGAVSLGALLGALGGGAYGSYKGAKWGNRPRK